MKKFFGYFGFTILITLFFLYYYFPSETAARLVQTRLKELLPQWTISVDKIAPILIGVNIEGLSLKNQNFDVFEADQFQMKPKILTLFDPNKAIGFKIRSYKGRIEGQLAVGYKTDINTALMPFKLDSKWIGVQLENIPAIKALNKKLFGTFEGMLSYQGIIGQPLAGTGNFHMVVSDSKVEFDNPFLGVITDIIFKSIEAKISFKDQTLILEESLLVGDFEGNITGTVSLQMPIAQSLIQLNGKVRPSANFQKRQKMPLTNFISPDKLKNGIPIKIYGTIGNPSFSYM